MFKITQSDAYYTECDTLGFAFSVIDQFCNEYKYKYDLDSLSIIPHYTTGHFNHIIVPVTNGTIKLIFKIFLIE